MGIKEKYVAVPRRVNQIRARDGKSDPGLSIRGTTTLVRGRFSTLTDPGCEASLARYLVTMKRDLPESESLSALDAVSSDPNVKVVASSNPNMITIETTEETADKLRQTLATTHFVEAEVRRELH
jgi:hypothetical protein